MLDDDDMDTSTTHRPIEGVDKVAIDGYAGELSQDHPGFSDPEYRARRAQIAQLAESYRPGDPIPHAPYSDAEHEVWRVVTSELGVKHQRYATAETLKGKQRLGLPVDHVPQLDEVNGLLTPLTGFRYEPVSGLVGPRDFYGRLGDGVFMSTQYIRHASAPRYTPEPDVIHEVIGHGLKMASDEYARLYRRFGEATNRCAGDDAVRFLSRVFWFTMEFGVHWEGDELKCYGAGLLSSFGEIEHFRGVDVRPLDILQMGTRSYDITRYQDVLFAADSYRHLEDEIETLLDGYDDDAFARLLASGTPQR
ncbi:MAG TPA: phenylalanine 4-monooxygenase [Euzebyales bacterium]|nr:phenylalanine 4-monooxygenase [Euzebyales bacterium]